MQTYVTSPFPPLRHVHILTQKGVCGLSVLGTREGVLMTSTQKKKTTNHHHDLRHAGDLRRACNVRCVGSKRTPPRKLKSMLVRSLRRIMMPSNPTVLQKGISVCCTTQITLFSVAQSFYLPAKKDIQGICVLICRPTKRWYFGIATSHAFDSNILFILLLIPLVKVL